MKKSYFLIWIILSHFSLSGCDICGSFMGITPFENQSSIGLIYRMRSFNGYYHTDQSHNAFPSGSLKTTHGDHTTDPGLGTKTYSQKDYEIYRVAELRARYFIHKRIEINVIIPHLWNQSKTDGAKSVVSGAGDLTFYSGYHLLNKTGIYKWQNRVIGGAGIKLPSGRNSLKTDKNERFNFLLQPGTGSTDYFFYLNYMTSYRKVGADINTAYRINGKNKYNESIANGLTVYMNLFYKFKWGQNIILIPSVQTYYEKTNGLKVNNVIREGTSMHVALCGPGFEIFYKNFSLHGAFQFPVYEQKEEYRLGSAGRLIAGCTYNFNQKKYIIHSKKK